MLSAAIKLILHLITYITDISYIIINLHCRRGLDPENPVSICLISEEKATYSSMSFLKRNSQALISSDGFSKQCMVAAA